MLTQPIAAVNSPICPRPPAPIGRQKVAIPPALPHYVHRYPPTPTRHKEQYDDHDHAAARH